MLEASEVENFYEADSSNSDSTCTFSSYDAVITEIFSVITDNPDAVDYLAEDYSLKFTRECMRKAATKREVDIPKNLGDVIYTFRYRRPLPQQIVDLAPEGKEWLIDGNGLGRYQARLIKLVRLTPNPELEVINVPDDTSPFHRRKDCDDEQFMLAKIRDSRLIAIFLGLTTWSRQNHLRTTVKGIGQIEIDEIYTAIDKHGVEYVVPVQAKGHNDKHSIVQTRQDIAYCQQNFPDHTCIPVSAQFMGNGTVALFRLNSEADDIQVEEELHYRLVTEW